MVADNAINNMEKDFELFETTDKLTLRTYTWDRPSITYGHSQNPDYTHIPDHKNITAKRPTGGGIVIHSPGDLTYCIVTPIENSPIPTGIEASCIYIHEILSKMLKSYGIETVVRKKAHNTNNRDSFEKICFAAATRYELVTAAGKKIAGSAQKKSKDKMLIQGTLLNKPDYSFWKQYNIPTNSKNSTSIYKEIGREIIFQELAEKFTDLLQQRQAALLGQMN